MCNMIMKIDFYRQKSGVVNFYIEKSGFLLLNLLQTKTVTIR